MNNILDEPERESIKNKTFSKLSFLSAVVTLLLIIYIFNQIPTYIKASESFPVLPKCLAILTNSFCVIGLAFAIISFVKKEPSSFYKWAGGIINLLMFLFIAGAIIFSRIV